MVAFAGGAGLLRPCPLPVERQLSVADLRTLERRSRQPRVAGPATVGAEDPAPAPLSGEPRRIWLRRRLLQFLREETEVCPAAAGATAQELLEVFETRTGEVFSANPGALLTSRVRGLAKVMGNITREEVFDPPLVAGQRRGLVSWNRAPRASLARDAWRRRVEAAELFAAPVPRLRQSMAAVDAHLAAWVREHRYLVPAELEAGESGMALLILWEVDHGVPFPSTGGAGHSQVLVGFTRRLQRRVAADSELSRWLVWADRQQPLAPGLLASHHCRWSVRVVRPCPSEPQGWYDEFVARWRAYLETQSGLVVSGGAASSAPVALGAAPAGAGDVAPATEPAPKRRRLALAAGLERRGRQRTPPAAVVEENDPPAKRPRRGDLRSWLLSRPGDDVDMEGAEMGVGPGGVRDGHGRAVGGAPT